jgi:hypothetical protein
LNSLAAIVVGGTSLSGGVGGPDRTLLGVLIITILDNGLNLLGVSSYPQLVIKGGGDRCRADQPKLTSDFVGEMIACNMGSLLIFGEESTPLHEEFLVPFRNGRSRLWLRPLDPYEDDINQNFTVGYKTAGSARGFLSIWLGH